MKCPECDQELTDKQAIKALEKRVEQLERELAEEKFKAVPYIPYPYVPYDPFRYWQPVHPDPDPYYINPTWTWIGSGIDSDAQVAAIPDNYGMVRSANN